MSSFAKVIGAKALPEIFNPRHSFLVLQQKYQAKSLQEYVNKHFAENMAGADVVFKTNYFDMFYFLREHGLRLLFPRVKFVYIHRATWSRRPIRCGRLTNTKFGTAQWPKPERWNPKSWSSRTTGRES